MLMSWSASRTIWLPPHTPTRKVLYLNGRYRFGVIHSCSVNSLSLFVIMDFNASLYEVGAAST